MKTILIFLTVLTISFGVYAQSPAPEPDTLKQVKQTDPEANNIPTNSNYMKNHVKISPTQIPVTLKHVLDSDPLYKGWEKGMLYKSKTENYYTVEITKSDTTRTYRFDKTGRPFKE